jgi:hypothetical protein
MNEHRIGDSTGLRWSKASAPRYHVFRDTPICLQPYRQRHYSETEEGYILADVLGTAKARRGLVAFALVKLKAFFDRDAAIVLPQRSERKRVG